MTTAKFRIIELSRRFFNKPGLVFIIPALVFGIVSAIITPQLSANDENMHFLRSYDITNIHIGQYCSLPRDVFDRAQSVYDGNFSFDNDPVDFADTKSDKCGSASAYNPLMHLPQSIGIAIGKVVWPSTGGMILLGRIANLVFYSATLYFIIRRVKIGKWALVVIGLFPLMIHLAGSLSADVWNNVVILAFVAYMFNLFVQTKPLSRNQIIKLFLLSILLATTKVTNVILLLPLAFLPKRVLPAIKKLPSIVIRSLIISACVAVAIISIVAWQQIYNAPVVGGETVENPLISRPLHFVRILFNTYIDPTIGYNDVVLRGIIGEFASYRYHLPSFMLLLLFGVFTAMLMRKDADETKLLRLSGKSLTLSTLASFVIMILVISYALYVTWAIQPFRLGVGATYADGVQGRYFTPLLFLLVPAFIMVRKYVSFDIKKGVITGIVVFSITTFSLLFYTLQTIAYF